MNALYGFYSADIDRLTLSVNTTPDDRSRLIRWDDPYPYPECYDFTVFVNGVQKFNGSGVTNYIVRNLDLAVYNVCVTAEEEGAKFQDCTNVDIGKFGCMDTLVDHWLLFNQSVNQLIGGMCSPMRGGFHSW